MATATDVVNGAIIVAPPIAPATDSATAFASKLLASNRRARTPAPASRPRRVPPERQFPPAPRRTRRRRKPPRSPPATSRSAPNTQTGLAPEAPVDVAQFAEHMRQAEQRQRRRIGGERRHRRESRERKNWRNASATAAPTSIRERGFMAAGERGASARRRSGRLRIGRRLLVRGLWRLGRWRRRFAAAGSIWRSDVGARGSRGEREARDRKGETTSAYHGPSYVTRERR